MRYGDIDGQRDLTGNAMEAAHGITGVHTRDESTISYDSGSRTISVTSASSTFRYYINGEEFNVSTLSDSHEDTTSGYFFYKDSSDSLILSTTPWDIIDSVVPLAYLYYDSRNSDAFVFEERHGSDRNLQAHQEFHRRVGTYWFSGFAAEDYTLEPVSPSDEDNQYAIASGVMYDEDLDTETSGLTSGGPYYVFWRNGADGEWTWDTNTVPLLAGTYIYYNEDTGSTWQLTELGNNNFVNMYVFAIPEISAAKQNVIIMGSVVYTDQQDAEDASFYDDIQTGNFPFQEGVLLHKFTMRTSAAFSTTGKCRIEAYADLRESTTFAFISGSSPATNHNSLASLQLAADTVTWGHIDDQAQALAGVKTFLSFPVSPSAAPISDYELVNKKYVDDQLLTSDTFSEVLANGNISDGNDVIVSLGDKLGIGTASPTVSLSLEFDDIGDLARFKDTASSNTLNIASDDGTFFGLGDLVYLYSNGAGVGLGINDARDILIDSFDGIILNGGNAWDTSIYANSETAMFVDNATGNVAFHEDSAGRVGIGGAPDYRLEVIEDVTAMSGSYYTFRNEFFSDTTGDDNYTRAATRNELIIAGSSNLTGITAGSLNLVIHNGDAGNVDTLYGSINDIAKGVGTSVLTNIVGLGLETAGGATNHYAFEIDDAFLTGTAINTRIDTGSFADWFIPMSTSDFTANDGGMLFNDTTDGVSVAPDVVYDSGTGDVTITNQLGIGTASSLTQELEVVGKVAIGSIEGRFGKWGTFLDVYANSAVTLYDDVSTLSATYAAFGNGAASSGSASLTLASAQNGHSNATPKFVMMNFDSSYTGTSKTGILGALVGQGVGSDVTGGGGIGLAYSTDGLTDTVGLSLYNDGAVSIPGTLGVGIVTPLASLHVKADGTTYTPSPIGNEVLDVQAIFQPSSTTGEEANVLLIGATNLNTSAKQAGIYLGNYDDNVPTTHWLGHMYGQVDNSTDNDGGIGIDVFTSGIESGRKNAVYINEEADVSFGYKVIMGNTSPPTDATDPGTSGQIAFDADYIYVCTATNTWKRSAIATWT